ncbi:MAG TPA: anthranilate synthase component I [Terriglobales bacterium]|nr:anthranilate synthase component I [Terriglobales bacterium]
MLRPDAKEFLALAGDATLVPVSKSISADLLTPVSAFLALAAGEPHAFLLESVEGGEKIGRYTFLGARPYMIVTARGEEVRIEYPGNRRQAEVISADAARAGPLQRPSDAHVFRVLRDLLRQHKPAQVEGLPPFTAGAVGFLSYDAVRQLERIPERAKDDLGVPDGVFMFFDRLLAFDHLRHELHIMAAANVKREPPRRAHARALRDIAAIERKLLAGPPARDLRPPKPVRGPVKLNSRTRRDDFIAAVKRAKEYIAAGDAFQVVLSQRFDLEPKAEPLAIYRALRRVNPSPYMYLLRMGGMHVLGSSPEMLVKVNGRHLEYRPIAGTMPRGRNEADDQQLEQHLRCDAKERAEHVMLVDLGRNDIGRVSEYGSVKVRDLMYVERYSHVMHLVSAIEGRLRPELDAFDALASCFPAGTLSGAPKVRAMEIIEELEPVRRGVYGGSVLYADFAGNLDSCIAIRTMLTLPKGVSADKAMRKKPGSGATHAYLQAGAGIVADSDPASEHQECANKAQALVRAVAIARGG